MQYLFSIFSKKFLYFDFPPISDENRAFSKKKYLVNHPKFVVHLAIISPFSLTLHSRAYKIR